MPPFAATVRYRFSEGDGSRNASCHGLFFDRSERAVLGRLEEAHRFAAWVEVVEVRWRDRTASRQPRLGCRQYSVSSCDRRECIPVQARNGSLWSGGMETMAITRESGGERAGDGGRWRPRRRARCSMFKPAQVVLEDVVLDCVLLDLSPGGAQVYLIARAELPDRVTLWLPGGESRAMLRRWQRGSHIGFEAAGTAVPPS